MELPPLTGTPKQIAWAESIRARLVATMDAQVRETEAHSAMQMIGCSAAMQLLLDRQRRYFAAAKAQVAARWWIERRDWGVAQLAAEAMRNLRPASVGHRPEKKPPLH